MRCAESLRLSVPPTCKIDLCSSELCDWSATPEMPTKLTSVLSKTAYSCFLLEQIRRINQRVILFARSKYVIQIS